jgi:hypothetical protein
VLAEDTQKAKAALKGHVGHANISQYVLKELTNEKATVSKGKTGHVTAKPAKSLEVGTVKKFEVRSDGVLGVLDGGDGGKIPDDHVIVDPAGHEYIQQGPLSNNGAGGLSKVIYEFLGIYKEEYQFPDDVKNAIKEKKAAYHQYDNARVIHVVGPDFRGCPDETYGSAIGKLSKAYASVFEVAEALQDCKVVRLPLISGGIFSGKFRKHASKENECFSELTARAIFEALRRRTAYLTKRYLICLHDTVGKPDKRMLSALQWAERTKHVTYEAQSGSGTSTVEYEDFDGRTETKHKSMLSNSSDAVLLCVSLVCNGWKHKIGGTLCLYEEGIPRVETKRRYETQNRPEENIMAAWMLTEASEMNNVLRSTVGGHDIQEGECVVVEKVYLGYGTNNAYGEYKIEQTVQTKAIAFIASNEDKETMKKNVLAGLSAAAQYTNKVVIAVDSEDIYPLKRQGFTSLVREAANQIGNLDIKILGPLD